MACSSAMAAFNWGTEALMFGSLMMFASGLSGQCSEFGEGVTDLLFVRETLREIGDDASGERDVAGFDRDASVPVNAWTIGSRE